MQFLHAVHCVVFNNLYNQHWNWCLFCLQYKYMNRDKETTSRYDYVYEKTI